MKCHIQSISRFAVAVALCLVGFAGPASGQEASPKQVSPERSHSLKKELKSFEKYIGTWVIDGGWKNGDRLWAKNEYSVGMNGNFVEARTYAKNEHGKAYQRYLTIWRFNKDKGAVESHGFTYDGSVDVNETEIDGSGDGHPVFRSKWQQADGSYIKQEVQLIDDLSYSWKVWTSGDGEQWERIMDGVWKKQVKESKVDAEPKKK